MSYQLRWLRRIEYLSESTARNVDVLQFRTRDLNPPVHFVREEDRWSDWQDVPVVKEWE